MVKDVNQQMDKLERGSKQTKDMCWQIIINAGVECCCKASLQFGTVAAKPQRANKDLVPETRCRPEVWQIL